MKDRSVYTIWGMACVVTGLILGFSELIFWDHFIALLAGIFSGDQEISTEGSRRLGALYGLAPLAALGAGYVLVRARDGSWRARFRRAFLEDALCQDANCRMTPLVSFALGTLGGALLVAVTGYSLSHAVLNDILYNRARGVLDTFVPIAALVAAILLFLAAKRTSQGQHVDAYTRRRVVAFWVVAALGLLFLAGEEKSWGQELFHWATPEMFAGNTEDQTNVHNFFNDYFGAIYMSLSLLTVISAANGLLEFSGRSKPWMRWVLPHPSQIGLCLWITLLGMIWYWYHAHELIEVLVALFALIYAIRSYGISAGHGAMAPQSQLTG